MGWSGYCGGAELHLGRWDVLFEVAAGGAVFDKGSGYRQVEVQISGGLVPVVMDCSRKTVVKNNDDPLQGGFQELGLDVLQQYLMRGVDRVENGVDGDEQRHLGAVELVVCSGVGPKLQPIGDHEALP